MPGVGVEPPWSHRDPGGLSHQPGVRVMPLRAGQCGISGGFAKPASGWCRPVRPRPGSFVSNALAPRAQFGDRCRIGIRTSTEPRADPSREVFARTVHRR